MMHVGNNTTEESNRAIKRTKKVHGVIEYIEKECQKYFSLYALVTPTFRAKQLAWWLCGDLKSLDDLVAEHFLNATTEKGYCKKENRTNHTLKLEIQVLLKATFPLSWGCKCTSHDAF
jgi:hypothetical protein